MHSQGSDSNAVAPDALGRPFLFNVPGNLKGGGHLPEWKKEHLSVARFHEHQGWWQIQAA